MELGKLFGVAAIVLGIITLGAGSVLVNQGTASSATSQALLTLSGQNLGDGGHRTLFIPIITRPSAQVLITLQSSGPVDVSVFDANGPLTTSGTAQATYTRTITPTYDTVATIDVVNSGAGPVTYTLSATETYSALSPQASQADVYGGYLGLAAGVGLLLLGFAVLMQKHDQLKVGSAK